MFERALLLCSLSAVLVCACSGDDDSGDIACFASGTQVATPGGEVAIEDLQPGDRVLSLDRASGAVVPVTVTHVQVHRDRAYRLLELPGGARLGVTDNHPVFEASSSRFVPAGRLSDASRLLFLAGDAAAVGSGLRVTGEGRGDVYDLSVTGDHVFFAAGVLVHNKNLDASPPQDAHACDDDVNACQIWPGQPPAGQPLVGGELAVVGACLALPAAGARIDYVSGPGGGVWLDCGS